MIDIDYYRLISVIGLSIVYVWSRANMVATWIYKITIARATYHVSDFSFRRIDIVNGL